MSSITFADNKLGGRITASCDAIAAGHLNRAAGILAELADELNVEATQEGLLAIVDAADDVPTIDKLNPEAVVAAIAELAVMPPPQLATSSASMDLQMCARNVHAYGEPDKVTGWRECAVCGSVNVAPPQ